MERNGLITPLNNSNLIFEDKLLRQCLILVKTKLVFLAIAINMSFGIENIDTNKMFLLECS